MAVAKQDSGSKKNTETKTQTVSVGGRDVSTKTTSTPKQTTQQKVTVGGRDVTVNAPKPTYTSKAQNVNSNPTVGGRQLSNRQVATGLVNQARNNTKPVEQKTQRKQEANPYKKSYTEDDYNSLKDTLYKSAEDPYYDMMWSNVEYKDMWTPEAQKEFDDYNANLNKLGEEAQVAKGDVATQKEIQDTQGNYKLNDVIDYTKNQWKDFSQDLTKYEAEQRDLIAKNQQYESLMEQLGDGEEYQKYKAESDITKNRLDELDGLIRDIKGRQAYQNALQKRLQFEDLRANGSKDEFLEYSKYAGAYMNNVLEDIALNYEASQFRKLAGVQTFIENVQQSFGENEAKRITDTITKLYTNGDVTEEEKDEVLAYAQNIVDRNTTKPGESFGVQLNDIANQLSMMQENGETATEKLFVDVVGNVLDNSIGQLGPAIAFGRAGMMASTALMSMSGYTQTYQQDIEAGFTHEQAQLDALFQSGVEFLSEMIGGERILRFAEGEVLPRTFGQMVVEGFKSGFAESVEEGLGWSVSPIAHYMATGEVPSIESWNPEELKQAVVTAFLAGFVQAEMSADYSQFGMEAPLSATEQTLKNFLTISTDEGKNRVQDLITELNVMGRDASWRKNIFLADGSRISESQYINMVKNMAELSLNEYNDKIQVKGVEIINQDRVDPIMSLAEDSKYSLKDCLEVTRQEKINSLMQSLNAGEVIQTINEQYEQDVAKKMVAQESERLAEIQKQLDKDGVKVKAPMWEQMSDEAKTNATIVSKVSDLIGGTPIEFADLRTSDGKIVDGFYDDGKIIVNPNAKLGAISTFIHEYTHGIEANKFYSRLRDEVKFLYGKDYQTLVKGIKKEYSNIKKLSQEDAERELTAKTVQKMLGNKQFVERLVKYHTDMAYKMYTDLKSMTTYSTVAESMAQTFLKAFNDNDLKQDELKRDGMYSVAFNPSTETVDNEGRKLSEGQKKYFKGSKITDAFGNLLRIYHTAHSLFSEFDPRGTDFYRYGNKIVNFFSTNKIVSGSYANGDYEQIASREYFDGYYKTQQEIEDLRKEAGDKYTERRRIITDLEKQARTAVKESNILETVNKVRANIEGANVFSQNDKPLLADTEAGWNPVVQEHLLTITASILDNATNSISKITSIRELADLTTKKKFYHFKATQELADMVFPVMDIDLSPFMKILNTYESETKRLEQERSDILDRIDELRKTLNNGKGKQYVGYGKSVNPYILENESGIIVNWNSINDGDWKMSPPAFETVSEAIGDELGKLNEQQVDELTTKNRINRFILDNVNDIIREYLIENPIALANYTNIIESELYGIRGGFGSIEQMAEDFKRGFSADDGFPYVAEDTDGNIYFKRRLETNDVVKAVLAVNDFTDNPYDGVVFKNMTDSASEEAEGIESDIIALFDSDQFKLIENENPTESKDIRYSFDGEEDAKQYYATIAPYLDTRLNENNRQELIDRAEKAYDGVAKEIAKSLGISPAPKTENIGGYENNEGQKLRELSWTFDLGEIDSTKARLFTSLMGDLAFENQEAVICMRYLDENEGDHKVGEEGEDGGTYGKEYGFQFNDLKTVEESLLKADITNYNIDRESNYLKVQDFGFDPNFDQKLDILLEGNNYESAEERPIYSYYLSREGRQSLYETQLKTKEVVREGNESDLSGRQVEEANRRVSDVIKNGQNSPFLRRAEAQDNERSDLEFTEKDLKNYNVIRPTTERKYSEDKNIDKETGVLSPKFITELDATVGRTTRKAEIDDAENYAEMVATQLDNGADPEDVLNQIKEEPLNNGVIRALTIGQVLADRGLYDEMHELAQWARDTDRLAGQLIESNKHLYQLDNEMSRSIYLTKVEQNLIDEYNAKFKRKSDIDIEETVHKIFSDAFEATVKSKTVREFRDAVGALARQVNKAMPKTVWDRIRQYRMISMLSGIKTAVSNFVSNVATHGLYRMNNFNQAILEMAMKDITVKNVDDTRKFTISDDQRNTTLRKNREVSKRNKRYADKIWEQIDKGAKSKYGDDVEKIPDIIKNSKAYKTKTQYNTVGFKAKSLAGKALDLVQSVQAYMLDDSPIAKLAFRDRFNDICQARNIDVRTLDPNSKQFSSVVDSAFDYAEEVVSHNATAISKTLANIQKYSSTNVRVDKDSLTKGVDEAIKLIKERANKGESMYVLLDGTLRKMEDWFVPFYKTNASLMQKALQFSPLEWAQVKNDYDKVKAGRMDLVDMVDHMSKAVTGTTLYMLGAIFAYLGWLKWDKDDEDYSGRLAIKIPGTNIGYTADFLDPISTIFAKGVVLAQELMENGVSFTTLQKLAGDYGDIFLNDEMDMFSSMKDFFDTVGKVQKGEDDYGEYTIADGATDTAFTILNSYIPALMRDISRVIDPAKKSTYDNSNMKYLFNRLLNSTPFRTKLADKKDATGRTINYTQPFTGNDVFDRILTQMISKGKLVDMEGKAVTTRSDNGNLGEKADEMSQMAQDFQFNDANGDGYSDTHWIRDTVPANIYPGGEQVQLSSEERDEYGKTWTDVWTSGAKSLLNNSVYKGLDYEKQADVVYELQGFARECIEADYCFEHNIELTKAQKTATAIREFCTTNGKIDGKKLGLIALGTAKENKLANGGQRYVLGKRDEDGKTITNSRQLYMRQLYEQAGIYDEIVKAVAENDNLSYQDFGLGKTVVEKYSADTAKSKYAEIYGAVMAKANSDSSNKKTSSSGAKKSSRKSSKKSSNISGGSSGIRKAGKLSKLAPVTSRNVINDKKIANGATNYMKAYASVFNRSGKKPTAGGSSGSVTCPRCGSTVSSSNGKCPVCGANL